MDATISQAEMSRVIDRLRRKFSILDKVSNNIRSGRGVGVLKFYENNTRDGNT